jgi:hypothetical protein
MDFDLIHTEEREGFRIQFLAAPEDEDPNDHFDDDGETARMISEGNYDWFIAQVTASKGGVTLGVEYLGGCCYESAGDFIRNSGYYEDMVAEAIAQARNTLSDLGVAA